MKKLFFIFFSTAVCLQLRAQSTDATLAYINQYKELAIDEMIRTGVPASITLAQGIMESNAGQSDLVQQSNNHFGIKCKDEWTGGVCYHDDDIKHECFRRYNSAEDSYRDHSDFLKTRSNYAFLFDIDATDYVDWAYGLKKAGYATNPVYAQTLITTIEKYNLEDYTDIAMQRSNQVEIASLPQKVQTDLEFTNVKNISPSKNAVQKNNNESIVASNYPEGVFYINQTKVVFAKEGTSLLALASNYNIPYKKLLEYNDLNNVDILQKPTLIYLQKKPKRGSKQFHIVKANERLNDIASAEGVQLQSILVYNNLQNNTSPKAGDKILLQ